jgi:1-acyl-sn-glycerol-3-phosphate acyltransferase
VADRSVSEPQHDYVYPPVIGAARVAFAAMGLRFTVTGTENVPRTGGAVMAINHTGYLDFTFAGLAARPAKRLVRFMCKEEIFEHPVAGPLMRGMHHIPVDRAAGMSSYATALRTLRDGEIVGVFPEATISRSFEVKEIKSGAVRMAAATGVPLLPTVIWGSQRVWTKGGDKRFFGSPVPIHVHVGEPIAVGRRDDHEAAAAALRSRMQELLEQVQARYPLPRGVVRADLPWLPARLGGAAPTPDQAAALDAR